MLDAISSFLIFSDGVLVLGFSLVMHAIVFPVSKNENHEEQREVGIERSPDGSK